jgi:MFS family permease
VLGYKPLHAGLASLPVTAGVLIAAATASQLMPKIGAKPLMLAGSVLAASAMFIMSLVDIDTSFAAHLLPAQVLLGLGLGFTFVPLSSLALVGVPEHDAGAASATLNATQQIGGSLGTALLSTISVSAATAFVVGKTPGPLLGLEAQTAGYTAAFRWGAVLILVAGVATAVLVKVSKEDLPVADAVHAG